MKAIDREKGRLFGVNAVDLAVVVIVLFLIFSFGMKILAEDLRFSGDEMYNAVQAYQKLDSKGFLIEADVAGKLIVDDSNIQATGIIIETRSGTFALKGADGSEMWIGGSMAYLEDIAASTLTFRPLNSYVTPVYLEPMEFPAYSDFLSYSESVKAEFKADNLLLSTDVSFLNSSMSAQEILNRFNELYRVKYAGIAQAGGEVIIRLKLAELSELEKLSIDGAVVIGKTTVHVGYNSKPSIGSEYHVASLEELR